MDETDGNTTEPRRQHNGIAMEPKTVPSQGIAPATGLLPPLGQGLGATAAKRCIAAGSCAAASSFGQSSGGLPWASMRANTA